MARTTAEHGRRSIALRGARVAIFTALVAGILCAAATPSHAASAVGAGSADPPAFVPNWDGHTDSTVIEYKVLTRSTVDVQLVNARGLVVAHVDRGVRETGSHVTWWDGRDDDGRVLPPGAYRIRIVAVPVAPLPGEPGEAGAGGNVVAGTTDVPVTIEAPSVAVGAIRMSRGAIGRSAKIATTQATFTLSVAASVSAVVVDAKGRGVRTLFAGPMRGGPQSLTWDGKGPRGRAVDDGSYALLVSATGGGKPTATLRMPLRVDRTAPGLRTAKRVKAAASAASVVVPVPIVLSEAATVRVALGKRVYAVKQAAGSRTLRVPGAKLGLVPSRSSRVVRVAISALDETGNERRSVTVVVIPRVAAPKPKPPVSKPPSGGGGNGGTQGPPVTSSGLRWPIDGIVTSKFGLRNGRPHTGIDIAASTGTPIVPATAGTVSYVGPMDGYGNLVIVDHANGLQTYYAHMSRFGRFVVGDKVGGLDEIGYVGCTGNCTGPHLHFETRVNGKPQDPEGYLKS